MLYLATHEQQLKLSTKGLISMDNVYEAPSIEIIACTGDVVCSSTGGDPDNPAPVNLVLDDSQPNIKNV